MRLLLASRSEARRAMLAAAGVEFATIDAEQELGRIRIAGGAEWRRYRFDDAFTASGQRLDQTFRNRDVTTEQLKVDYALSPRFALYVAGSANQRSYDIRPIGAPARDSHGYTIEGGADFDITNLVRGHVQLGYLSQTGKSGLWSAHGLSGRGKVDTAFSTFWSVRPRSLRRRMNAIIASAC